MKLFRVKIIRSAGRPSVCNIRALTAAQAEKQVRAWSPYGEIIVTDVSDKKAGS